jgi:uncharacterized protein (DUF58 family)
MSSEGLLAPDFLRTLEALRRRLEVRARSGQSGEYQGPRRGGSAEFREHRSYETGDDLRRVDWLAYARTGQPVVKLFRSEEDVALRMLIDASASLDYGEPRKLVVAQRLAAAVGYLSLSNSQRAQVFVASAPDATDSRARALGVSRVHPMRRGRAGLAPLLGDLSSVLPGGQVNLSRAIGQLLRVAKRPGLLTVLSDFFDAGELTEALSRARASGHDVALIQVLDRTELEPHFEGDLTLLDAESGDTIDVTMDRAALAAYSRRLWSLIGELRDWARRHDATYIRVIGDETLEWSLRRFVMRRID